MGEVGEGQREGAFGKGEESRAHQVEVDLAVATFTKSYPSFLNLSPLWLFSDVCQQNGIVRGDP